MATRSQMPVGSSQWIAAEQENVLQLLQQEKEEIVFPAQHEMEWLNEHMAEIFSRTQFNVTDVFKTPGKMRGKTPRTNRKRNISESRVPLSDVFSTNLPAPMISSPARAAKPNRQHPHFSIATDMSTQPKSSPKEKSLLSSQHYTDSGYHGSTTDDMEIDEPVLVEPIRSPQLTQPTPLEQQCPPKPDASTDERRTTEGSFHSAREEMTRKMSYNREQAQPEPTLQQEENNPKDAAPSPQKHESLPKVSPRPAQPPVVESAAKAILDEPDFSDLGSPSDGSTPDRPLIRKSSLTFASLPAREPIPTKKSMGNRISRTSQLDQAMSRNSYFGRQTGGPRLTQAQPEAPKPTEKGSNEGNDKMTIELEGSHAAKDDSGSEDQAMRLHTKSKTQQLHERIGMLGKSQPSRASKSIPSTVVAANNQVRYPNLASEKTSLFAGSTRPALQPGIGPDDDDDWIKPLASPRDGNRPQMIKSHTADVIESVQSGKEDKIESGADPLDPKFDHEPDSPEFQTLRKSPSPSRFGHTKSASTVSLISPSKAANPQTHKQNISVSNPTHGTTTPSGSPKRLLDGPLSASKSKFQSIMKTAKGLFTSGAGVSAAAKMETMSPNALKLASENMPGLFPTMNSSMQDKALPPPPSPSKEGRKTRSSTEREREEKKKDKEAKERQRMQDQLDKVREKERHKAAEYQQKQLKASASVASLNKPSQAVRRSPRRAAEENTAAEKAGDIVQMPPPASLSHQPSVSRMNEARRPVKPAFQALSKQKEPPRNIRIGMPSQRVPPSNSAFSGLQDTLPPAATKPNTVTKKPSTQSLHTNASNSSLKSSVNSQAGRLKSLTAAARKKEQDEREARRKEELRQEQRARVEAEKKERERAEAERKERERVAAEEAKRQAQKQALERKRQQEQAKRIEQQRAQQATADLSSSMQQERPPLQRNDASRPPSRLNPGQTFNRSMVNHPLNNTGKSTKRPLEEDTSSSRPQPTRFGTVAAAPEPKRRRTEDETAEPTVRPIMAPPQRQSNIKKDHPKSSSIFAHGYTHAPPVAAHHQITSSQANGNNGASSSSHYPQYPSNAAGHRAMHPMDLAKYTNGKVPFAEAPNPPQATSSSAAALRTPAAPPQPTFKPSTHAHAGPKSSPHYPNGENIHLPDIPTDSDEDDSDASPFPVPGWAEPDALRSTLINQDAMNVDPDTVFGPMAPLKMEELFVPKGGNKERMKRWRERTSSANWVVSGDGLTVEEVRADREARERIRGEGGWRFGNGNL